MTEILKADLHKRLRLDKTASMCNSLKFGDDLYYFPIDTNHIIIYHNRKVFLRSITIQQINTLEQLDKIIDALKNSKL